MADKYGDGLDGQVSNKSYCMKDSVEARNVDEMNEAYGYNDKSNLANTGRPPTQMKAATRNPQLGATMPGNNKANYKP
jgi:hypothetical protein